MKHEASERLTIDKVGGPLAPQSDLSRIVDHGLRRHRCWGFDFDTRAVLLNTKIEESWEESIKHQWVANKSSITEGLKRQFGEIDHQRKVQNFTDLGVKPFSIIAHHNSLFAQVRNAFVIGAYYPALTGACALGERILNHLVIDLRDCFRETQEYKHVHRKKSFDDWKLAVQTLAAWDVLLDEVKQEFEKLEKLRHRSIHFSPETYPNLRADALAASIHIREIVGTQFGVFGTQPWFIEGVMGASFIKKEFQSRPFISKCYLAQSPFVGIRNAIEFDQSGHAKFLDIHDYGDGQMTDEEFRDAFNNRDPNSLATSA